MGSSSTGWRELPRYRKSECPKLFYNYTTTDDNLILRLTDLVAIWEYSLDRLQILKAAEEQRSSIDPSESNAQLRVLLDKVQQSLEGGGNRLFRGKEPNTQDVYLTTELDLPKPLKPLKWTFKLLPQDAGELAERLLRPCLHEASVTKQKLDSLLRVIRDKDHVLSRLLEKIDNSAIDLSLIFPGITGLKSRRARVTVQEAQKHVPGMAEFEPEKWATKFEVDSPYSGFDQMGMKCLVSGCERCPKHTAKQHADWLHGLPTFGSAYQDEPTRSQSSMKRETSQNTKRKYSSDTDSDFERQPTPPHLKKHSIPEKHISDSEESERPAKKPKLGQVGGTKGRKKSPHLTREPSSSPQRATQTSTISPPPKQSQPGPDSDTETATESDTSTKPDPKPSQKQTTPPKLHRLGSLTPSKTRYSTPDPISPAHRSSKTSTPHSIRTRPSKSSSSHSASPTTSHAPQPTKPSRQFDAESTSDDDLDLDEDSAPPTQSQTQTRQTTRPLSPVSRSLDFSAERNPSSTNTTAKESEPKPTTPRKLGRLSKSRSISSAEVTPSKPKLATQPSPVPEEVGTPSPETESDSERPVPRLGEDAKRELGSSSPSPAKPVKEEIKKETAEEAANRRREELKSRISGAGKGKKKRKF